MTPYIKIFCYTVLVASLVSCSDDGEKSCTTCTSEFIQAFELCRESNGDASVDGENTGTNFEVYLQGLQETGVVCGQ